MNATTALESKPPLKKAPRGTSLISLRCTDCLRSTFQLLRGLFLPGWVRRRPEPELPVRTADKLPVPDHQQMSGRKPADAVDDRLLPHDITVGKIFMKRPGIDLPLDHPGCEKGLDLGSEEEPVPVLVVIKRLLAEPILREDQPVFPGVPEGAGEHSVELREGLQPVLQVQRQQDLGVRSGPESMPFPLQPPPQFREIVDFPVEHQPDPPVGTPHGLLPGRQVDDAQPSMGEADRPLKVEARLIGTPVGENPGHPLEPFRRGLSAGVEFEDARYAAHPLALKTLS